MECDNPIFDEDTEQVNNRNLDAIMSLPLRTLPTWKSRFANFSR